MRSETATITLTAPRDQVFDYLADIEKLPDWATEFARELKHVGGHYKVVNNLGSSSSRSAQTPTRASSTCTPAPAPTTSPSSQPE
jgi:uncharacterized membrane protein